MKSLIFLVSFLLSSVFHFSNAFAQDIKQILNARLDKYLESAPSERVFLINDKDIYAPGDFIWIDALVYDISKTVISDLSDIVKLRVNNSDGMEFMAKEMKLKNGRANGFMKLPENIDKGLYYLTGATSKSDNLFTYSKRILIREKIVPPFVIEVDFPDKYYIPGDELSLNVSCKDFYNEPKKHIEYELFLYDGEKRARIYSGQIKKGGQITQTVKIPADLRSGMLSYKIVADCKGIVAEQEGIIPLFTEKMFVDFYPTSGRLIGGFENSINMYAYDAMGQPMQIKGDLIANGQKISSVETGQNGMGNFVLNPSADIKYQFKVNEPVALEGAYDLPKGKTNGAILKEIARKKDLLEISISSNFSNPKPAFLIGISGNEIFWTSEHSLSGEVMVNVNLESAVNEIAHFILIDHKAEIEAEYIARIKDTSPAGLNPDIDNNFPKSNSKVEIKLQKQQEGSFVFASVNGPWMAPFLDNPSLQIINLPYDIVLSPAFQQSRFLQSNFEPSIVDEFVRYYIPYGFGWDRILNTDGALKMGEDNEIVNTNRKRYYEILANNQQQYLSGKVKFSNVTASSGFVTKNPKYLLELYKKERPQKVPPYKTLLENGTPLLEIIHTIKPFNLQGDKIVFMGSANSLMSQDGALIVVDGIQRGTSASVLQGINPWDVDDIKVSTNPIDIQRYTGLNSVGLVEITLKRGEMVEESKSEELPEDLDYETAQELAHEEGGDDYRSTLMWDVKNEASSYQQEYQHSEFISPVLLRMYFIPEKGSPSYYEMEYELK